MKGEIKYKQSDNNLINLAPHLRALQNEVVKLLQASICLIKTHPVMHELVNQWLGHT